MSSFLKIIFYSSIRSNLNWHPMLQHRAYITSSSISLKQTYTRSSAKFTKFKKSVDLDDGMDGSLVDVDCLEYSEAEYENLVDRTFRTKESGHNVLVIQPFIKWGAQKKRNTTPELQLAEAVTLIKTLKQWTVVDKLTISLMNMERSSFFGEGNLEMIQDMINANSVISAVFLSVNILKGRQRTFLEKLFNVPVFDRYNIVLQIFREHAISREAKLQLKLAEIPYMRGRIKDSQPSHQFQGTHGETFVEHQFNILKEKEKKIKTEIESLRNQRNILRKNRQKIQIPVVAVVGYTNAGKTSLIKAITGADKLAPKNVLFATLDVTVHMGQLPSGLEVLFVDTIGFISEIPTMLLESFIATLEDALLADVIIHVRDASHPDALAQMDNVHETLRNLNLSDGLMSNIIEVANKIDLVTDIDHREWSNAVLTSCVELKGIETVKETVEKAVIKATGMQQMDIRVKNGGEEYSWLYREATVTVVRADPSDLQFCLMSVIIAPHTLAKFYHVFIKCKR